MTSARESVFRADGAVAECTEQHLETLQALLGSRKNKHDLSKGLHIMAKFLSYILLLCQVTSIINKADLSICICSQTVATAQPKSSLYGIWFPASPLSQGCTNEFHCATLWSD